jgi:chloride channel protein, CIC family
LASGHLAVGAIVLLGLWKAMAWSLALGSGTSGGTLAPLFIIGGCGGALTGFLLDAIAPGISPGPALAALVGMAATFAGASRAVLASMVFAFEATRQPAALIPLMIGCSCAYLIAQALARHSIMTEKIARRGIVVSSDYHVDPLAALTVADVMCTEPETISGSDLAAQVRTRFAQPLSHHAYPVVNADGHLIGLISQRDIITDFAPNTLVSDLMLRDPLVIAATNALPDAIPVLRQSPYDRVIVVDPAQPQRVVGMLTSADLMRRR